MKDSLLVRRYAKALLDYSIENKMEDKAFDDLKIIFDVLKENKNLRNILAEPFISIEKKISIIEKLFKDVEICNRYPFKGVEETKKALEYSISKVYDTFTKEQIEEFKAWLICMNPKGVVNG